MSKIHKIQLQFDQNTSADVVIDQIMLARLKQIRIGLAKWNDKEAQEVLAACKVLIDWMGNPHAQD